jgi:hypothetical protein
MGQPCLLHFSPFRNNFSPSRRHSLQTGPVYLAIESSSFRDEDTYFFEEKIFFEKTSSFFEKKEAKKL